MQQLLNPLVKQAFEFAALSLAGKKRYSGEDFSSHCLKVAEILQKFKVTDPKTLAAAILHHSLSDGAATISDLEKEFGGEIAEMVKNVDSLRIIKLPDLTKQEFLENLRKMFLILAKDMRVVLIKFADILDNLRTLEYIPKEKQQEVSRETLEIFAPLAGRLGMGEMKGQMQDLAFPYLYPQEYEEVKKVLKTSEDELGKRLLKIKAELTLALEKASVKFRLEHRRKHLYSLFIKLKRPEINNDLNRVYDLIAFRIIVEDVESCYQSLGVVHKLWRPMPNYVRDYIANPKPNGYQSIHTTVFGPAGKPFEVQIRTEKMHQEAEYGVAAHWHYAEVKAKGASDRVLTKGVAADADRLHWVKTLSRWQEEIADNEELLKSIKTDLFGERIFCFTPKGDVKDLPAGSTPIDFAYHVHTDLGDLAVGAKVNGKVVSLSTKLKNGDVVEILATKDRNKKPSRDWLNFVITSPARRRIKKAFALE